jgi:hypothetical protein
MRDCYPQLSKLALNVLSILALSCECERIFSELGNLLEPRQQGIQLRLLAAIQCVRQWRTAGLSNNKLNNRNSITNNKIEALYGVSA